MNELNLIYKAILQAWGVDVKADSRIMLSLDGTDHPITLDEMDVYLPTDDALGRDSDTRVYFHPACESIISRESEIFKIIRRLAGFHLLVNFKKYPPVLFDIANRKGKKALNNERNDLLEPLRNFKQDYRREVAKLFESMEVEFGPGDTIDKRFVHFDVVKGGKSRHTHNKVYYRVKPTFPFYNEMVRKLARNEGSSESMQLDVCGEKVSYRSLQVAVHLFKSILPGVDDPESYEVEQSTAEAARFIAFCNSYLLVANDMNRVQGFFRQDFDKVGVYNLETAFGEVLENLAETYRLVPPMAYNSVASAESAATVNVNTHQRVANIVSSTSQSYGQPEQVTIVQQPSINHQVTATAADGFKSKVMLEMQPGETWVGMTIDPSTNQFLHQFQTASGILVKRYSQQGNCIAREFSNPMNTSMMNPMMMMMGGMGGLNANQIQQLQMMKMYSNALGSQPTGTGVVTPSNSDSSPVLF